MIDRTPTHWKTIHSNKIGTNQIHLWFLILPPMSEQYKSLQTARRQLLKSLLGQYLHCSPQQFDIAYSNKGKPYLAHHSLEFSSSHSKNYMILAIQTHVPIGIDLEYMRPKSFTNFSKKFWGDLWYQQQLASHPMYVQQLGFFQAWTQTEAWVKYHGDTIFNHRPFLPQTFPQQGIIQTGHTQLISWMPRVNCVASMCTDLKHRPSMIHSKTILISEIQKLEILIMHGELFYEHTIF